MSDPRFHNKTIVITGAGGNFGRSGCLYFLHRGARIAALDVDENSLNETIAEVQNDSKVEVSTTASTETRIKGYTCDVTNVSNVDSAIESIVRDFGRIDMLWNNAGYQGQIKPTLEYDAADFARVMNINVTGMFVMLQSVARQMSRQHAEDKAGDNDGGEFSNSTDSHPYSIVNTASVAGLRGTPAMVAYSSSKAAVLAMTVSSAKVCRLFMMCTVIQKSLFIVLSFHAFIKIPLCHPCEGSGASRNKSQCYITSINRTRIHVDTSERVTCCQWKSVFRLGRGGSGQGQDWGVSFQS